ncbi:Ig-like domain-containing protein [Luminiphilus syltensis]|uniref:Ig-like domain-containing protein n=1 Tax=Luminiphilus syltensis TaxID=1341119 RepID=UPI001E338870|nr:Ig-like domain-containing protein [Luminiphilus syltensis]
MPESAADNDMNPCFGDDGWVNGTGSYDCVTPAGFINHEFLTPPDGNNYGGGVQFSGVPGIQESISKSYTNLVIGQEYAVEWYVMTDLVQGVGPSAEAWFEVTLCSDTQDTLRLTPGQRRTWFQERLFFTADAETCDLTFTARNTDGDNSSWVFLDGVSIRAAVSSDLGITKTGPSQVAASGGVATFTITASNDGPDATSSTVDITDMLPAGMSVNGGAVGSVLLSGANSGEWTCTSDAGAPQEISCRSAGALANGESSTFSYTATVAPGAGGDELTNTATIEPTFGSGTEDPNASNDSSSTTVSLSAVPISESLSSINVSASSVLVDDDVIITVTVRDSAGDPVPDISVTMAVASASLDTSAVTIATSPTTTDSNGEAAYTVASSIAQSVQFQASFNPDLFVTVNWSEPADPPPPPPGPATPPSPVPAAPPEAIPAMPMFGLGLTLLGLLLLARRNLST